MFINYSDKTTPVRKLGIFFIMFDSVIYNVMCQSVNNLYIVIVIENI